MPDQDYLLGSTKLKVEACMRLVKHRFSALAAELLQRSRLANLEMRAGGIKNRSL
jgi:hypothetical protein